MKVSLIKFFINLFSGISKHICLLDDYSKFELPITEGVNTIWISIEIDEVLRINDKDYSITFSTYFNVEWEETRLWVDPELEVIACYKQKVTFSNNY